MEKCASTKVARTHDTLPLLFVIIVIIQAIFNLKFLFGIVGSKPDLRPPAHELFLQIFLKISCNGPNKWKKMFWLLL